MTLLPSLLRELENPKLNVNYRAELLCEAAKALEYKGEYEQARKLLADYWTRIGERPKLEGLEPNTAAEVLLRTDRIDRKQESNCRLTGNSKEPNL